ncbi:MULTISPECIES: pseudouridine synthase [Ahrensia]|uniref:pseudouridine synthase n=1 Tax=Ahrensia TaxID=152180 RepID=UPI0003776C78|nr:MULTISPECIES: pseudouridine synthase [Ahrensia]
MNKNDDKRSFKSKPTQNEATSRPVERIAKRLARAGIASRRDAEALIVDGRIKVNGKTLTTPALNVSDSDIILIDGKPIPTIERTRLWLYHKPGGLVTSNRDTEGRATVFESLPDELPRVVSVGRLDINTEGLLLLTNDGGLARVLELPQTGWLRRYRVRAHGKVTQQQLDKLKDGIAVDGVFYASIEARLEREQGTNVWIEVGLREGKNREVKNVMGALGLDVNRLIRISFGPFQLGELREGEVLEVKGRTLRDQLGDRLIEESGANFDAPVTNAFPNAPVRSNKPVEDKRIEASRRGDWVSGTKLLGEAAEEEARKEAKKAGRRYEKPVDKRERDRDSWSTQAPSEDRGKKPSFDKAKREARPSRSVNVWMAPGARPQGKRKDDEAEGRGDARGPRRSDSKSEGGLRSKGMYGAKKEDGKKRSDKMFDASASPNGDKRPRGAKPAGKPNDRPGGWKAGDRSKSGKPTAGRRPPQRGKKD